MRNEYPSGLWSEREGNSLKVGKGKKEKKFCFRYDSKINENVSPFYHDSIKKAGYKPSDFCQVDTNPLAKVLIPEIKECIQFSKNKKEEREREEREILENDIKSGRAFRTAEIASQYDGELVWSCRPSEEEKKQYAEWYRDRCMYSYPGSERIKVEKEAIRQVVGNRPSDGSFTGCENSAWIITETEWNKIVSLSNYMVTEREKRRKIIRKQNEEDIKRKIKTGFCFNCETWCYGDCGNYSKKPKIL